MSTPSDQQQPTAVRSFDQPVDRSRTSSQKWLKYGDKDILPLWVADTDFMSPPAVIDALHERIEHGIFGYTLPPQELTDTVIERFDRLYQWQLQPQWLVWLPGLVCGLNLACRAIGEDGSGVISPKPIYPPFVSAPRFSSRALTQVSLKLEGDRWLLDFDALERSVTDDTRVIMFCNPQNPGGTVYNREELQRLVDICVRHDLLICSDEIHCDLILEPGARHIPLASLCEEAAARTITLTAPSKTFNIAGLGCSLAIIPDQALRQRFQQVRKGIVPDVNLLGYTAALAAYRDGDGWNHEQLAYLKGNRDYLLQELNRIPGLKLRPFDATYLAWIDVSALQLSNPPAFFEQAGVGMSPGADFGDKNYMRLNFGCTRQLLEEAVKRIKAAVEKRQA